jgi:hypothetical protein
MSPTGQIGRIRNGRSGRPRLGYAYVHSAVDASSRLAYSEVPSDEQATTAIAFWRRARAFFASYGIALERVMTDNGKCYIAKSFGCRADRGSGGPHPDQALLPEDERESRALQPHPPQ